MRKVPYHSVGRPVGGCDRHCYWTTPPEPGSAGQPGVSSCGSTVVEFKQNPGVKIDWQFLENEAFKANADHATVQGASGPLLQLGRWRIRTKPGPGVEPPPNRWRGSGQPHRVRRLSSTYYGKLMACADLDPADTLAVQQGAVEKSLQWIERAVDSEWALEAIRSAKAAGIMPIATGGGANGRCTLGLDHAGAATGERRPSKWVEIVRTRASTAGHS